MPQIAHYCQKCLAANPLGQDFCGRCGTRLMIVVAPPAARFETGEGSPSSDEHLLERISAVENRLARLTEKVERGLDLLLRQAQNSYFDRSLVKALIGILTDDGIVQTERLEHLWKDRCQKDAADQEESARREEQRVRIIACYTGNQSYAFEQQVNEGFLLIEDNQAERGMRVLQRAAELGGSNSALLLFVGEYFFRSGKTKLAREYLSRAYEVAPGDVRVSLLLGLTCADEGDSEKAKELLSSATRRGGSSFAAHYALGRLFAAEKNWQRALREFKRALSSKPSPEAHYVLGCLYYQLCRDSLAQRHLCKAIEMDSGYGEAFYLLGLVYRRAGQEELAKQAFNRAENGALRPAQSEEPLTEAPLRTTPLFSAAVAKSRKLVTSGDPRLAEALREDALRAFVVGELDAR